MTAAHLVIPTFVGAMLAFLLGLSAAPASAAEPWHGMTPQSQNDALLKASALVPLFEVAYSGQ